MAITQRRLAEVIQEQCGSVEERVPGYRDELREAIAEVIAAERDHAVRTTNIQQRITEICDGLGDFLFRSRPASSEAEEA